MKPEDKVCTLKQANRLRDLGVEWETEHWWVKLCDEKEFSIWSHSAIEYPGSIAISAPDVPELMEAVPFNIPVEKFSTPSVLVIDVYHDGYVALHSKMLGSRFKRKCFAHTLGDILIHLIENGYVNPEEVCS